MKISTKKKQQASTPIVKKTPLSIRQRIIQKQKLKKSVKKTPLRTPLAGNKLRSVLRCTKTVQKRLNDSFDRRAKMTPTTSVRETILQYSFMPWAHQCELVEVRELIFSAVTFKPINHPGYNDKKLIIVQDDQSQDKLCYCRDKLSVWKSRCLNMKQSQIVLANLTAIESMLNILIEKYRCHGDNWFDSGHNSVLYSLYSIGVINLCNAIASYAQERNTLSVKNLARILECPSWIVDCRHQLSHPSINPPPEPLLHEAITFGFEWIDRIFWSKVTGIEVPKSIKPLPLPDSVLEPAGPEFGSSVYAQEIDQVHSELCLLLFTNCSNRKKFLRKNLQQFMSSNWNEFIRTFVSILVIDVPINVPVTLDSDKLPSILMSRCSGLFHLIFSTIPNIVSSSNILIFLLNQMIDLVASKLQMLEHNLQSGTGAVDPDVILLDTEGNDDHRLQLEVHSGYCWLSAILNSLTKLNRKTLFEHSFDLFGDLNDLKYECQYDWFRLFYRFSQLRPNQILAGIIKRLSFFVDRMIPKEKFDHIVNMCEMFVENNLQYNNTEQQPINNNGQTKMVNKSQPPAATTTSSQTGVDSNWNIKQMADLEQELITKKKLSALRPSNKINNNSQDKPYLDWRSNSVGCSLMTGGDFDPMLNSIPIPSSEYHHHQNSYSNHSVNYSTSSISVINFR